MDLALLLETGPTPAAALEAPPSSCKAEAGVGNKDGPICVLHIMGAGGHPLAQPGQAVAALDLVGQRGWRKAKPVQPPPLMRWLWGPSQPNATLNAQACPQASKHTSDDGSTCHLQVRQLQVHQVRGAVGLQEQLSKVPGAQQ